MAPVCNFLGLALDLRDVVGKRQYLDLKILRPLTAVDATVVHGHFIDSALLDELANAQRALFRVGLHALR